MADFSSKSAVAPTVAAFSAAIPHAAATPVPAPPLVVLLPLLLLLLLSMLLLAEQLLILFPHFLDVRETPSGFGKLTSWQMLQDGVLDWSDALYDHDALALRTHSQLFPIPAPAACCTLKLNTLADQYVLEGGALENKGIFVAAGDTSAA